MPKNNNSVKAMQRVMDRLDPNSTATSQCCINCGVRMKMNSTEGSVNCHACGNFHKHYFDLPNQVLLEFTPLEDVDIARALTYYHWTTRENWVDELPEFIMAHLGCKQAAYERARDAMYDAQLEHDRQQLLMPVSYDAPSPQITELTPQEGMVYSLRIIPGTPFETQLRIDDEDCSAKDGFAYSSNVLHKAYNRNCVERYLNVVEAPGSISLCATKNMFTVVKAESAREFFSEDAVEEAHEHRAQRIAAWLAKRMA